MQIALAVFTIGMLALAVPASAADDAPTSVEHPRVVLETSQGDIVIELYPDKAPKTVENFLSYVESDFYAGTIFHRVIAGFMIQGGGFTAAMEKKETRPPIENEAATGLPNDRGTISMARTADPDSATAQFFINTVDNAALDYKGPGNPGYAAFGRVAEGMDVVDAIAGVRTTRKGMFADVPVETVTVKAARVAAE